MPGRFAETLLAGITKLSSRTSGAPRARNRVRVVHDVKVPMSDGTILLADHHIPCVDGPRPTVLMRTPYGRSGLNVALAAGPYAGLGYHVLIQSARGTFGSSGTFAPMVDEASDGQDTVAWLRTQDWFDGRLATLGPSYLGYVQWALGIDPPPELQAMVVQIGPHDFADATWGQGAFDLYNFSMWVDLVSRQEDMGLFGMMRHVMTAERRLGPILAKLPLARIAQEIGGERTPWFADWLAHSDLSSDFWRPYNHVQALDRVAVPTLLIGGWHDLFVHQTLQQYTALNHRGVPTRLVIGPWTHINVDKRLATAESAAWLDTHLNGDGAEVAGVAPAVRLHIGGVEEWRDLPGWPPASAEHVLGLRPGGVLSESDGSVEGSTAFTYDPADPTPSIGGRVMTRSGGSRDNTSLERRSDVVTFTSEPLTQALEIAGLPAAELYVSSDNPDIDLFVRLCDVDDRGRSFNITDHLVRLSEAPGIEASPLLVRVELTGTAYTFLTGHRIRLQISGGALPRFSRNQGVPDAGAGETTTVRSLRRIHHSESAYSRLVLPKVG